MRTYRLPGFVLALLFLAGAPLARAAEQTRGPSDQLESLSLNKMAMLDVARLLSQDGGTPIIVSAKAGTTHVSTFLEDVSVETALRALCRSYNLWYREDDASDVIQICTVQEFRDGLDLYNDETVEVIPILYPAAETIGESIARVFGDRVIWTPPGDDEFDIDRVEDAVDRMNTIQSGGAGGLLSFGVAASGGGSGSSSRDDDDDDDDDDDETDIKSLLGQARSMGSVKVHGQQLLAEHVTDLESLSPEAIIRLAEGKGLTVSRAANRPAIVHISAVEHTNALLLRSADPGSVEKIKGMIRRLDKPTPQVLLEVKILDLEIGDQYARGVDWLFKRETADDFRGADSTMSGGFANGITVPGGQLIANSNTELIPQGTGMDPRAMVFSYVSDELRARLQLLEEKGKLVRLGTPNLYVADGEATRLFVGRESTLLTGVNISRTVSDGQTAVREETLITPETQRKRIGTSLFITPRIHADRTVTIRIHQEDSILGIQREIRYGGSDENSFITQDVEERSVVTTAMAADGHLVAISGLVEEEERTSEGGVPGLKKLPVVGKLFQKTTRDNSRRELMILVRPFILLAPGEAHHVSMDYIKRISAHPAAENDLWDIQGGPESARVDPGADDAALNLALAPHPDVQRAMGPKAGAASAAAEPVLPQRLRNAQELERAGQHTQAVVAYRDFMSVTQDGAAKQVAMLGLSRSLMRLDKHAAALNALMPLPNAPRDSLSRQRLSLAGEALLRMRTPGPAESVLEVSLAGMRPGTQTASWVGPTYANLGLAYSQNKKLAQAKNAFEAAARQFTLCGQHSAAAQCEDMVSQLGASAN